MKSIILIPAYQPGPELENLVRDLYRDPELELLIVNDGSTGAAQQIIYALENYGERVEILHHAINLGKGQALKTGINHFLVKYPEEYIGALTVDADGQHTIKDIQKVLFSFKDDPNSLHIGSRQLEKGVPFRSRFGNRLTSFVFRVVTGISLIDTQTGLRGIPRKLMPELLLSTESGYDFELDMLMHAIKKHMKINEIPIETVYIDKNKSSHFNVLRDSLKIYFVFFRFLAVSISTAGIDFVVFAILYWFTKEILISIIAARILAGLFQFYVGKYLVFRSKGGLVAEILKYASLVMLLMTLSYNLIKPLVNQVHFDPYSAKLLAEGLIFLLSFTAQNLYVYSKKYDSHESEIMTDWDRYYATPVKAAKISRKFTQNKLNNLIRTFTKNQVSHIIELGGGNSSFFSSLREMYPSADYTVIDNNEYGLNLFKKAYHKDPHAFALHHDVLSTNLPGKDMADVVFSVGLIEHFSSLHTAKAIKSHFSLARQSAIVIITFPTPTWLYVNARRIAEFFGAWKFPDERPLKMQEVITEAQKYGMILHASINWPIIFTQGIVVVQKT